MPRVAAVQVVSTVDPFGHYVAEIQEGLNDAFAGPSSPKAGSGEYAAEEEASEQPRAAKPSAVSPIAAPQQPEGADAAAGGVSSAAAAPLENGDTAEGADAAPPHEAAADPGGVDAPLADVAGVAPPAISTTAVFEHGPSGAASPMHASPRGSSSKVAATDAVLQKDAFLVFRALCKLSIRTADASSGTDLTAIRGKVRPPKP